MKQRTAFVFILLFAASILIGPTKFSDQITEDLTEMSGDTQMAQTFSSAKILFDEYHCDKASDMWTPGNASIFGWLLMEHGYNVSTNWDEPLDSGILDSYDILCLFFPQKPLTTGEIVAIHNFVDGGGGLLLVGVEHHPSGWGFSIENLNLIANTYGITFNSDKWLGKCLLSEEQLNEHHLTYDISSFHSAGDELKGCSLVVDNPAMTIAINHRSESVLATSESGAGRVVGIGAVAPFIIYRHGNNWQVEPDDHFQISLNIIDWLANNEERKVNVSEKAIIRVGSGPSLTESEIEEYEVFNGVYHDHTTYSDGEDTPYDMMIRSLEVSLDYFIVADHSYDRDAKNGIYGGLKVKEYAEKYDVDCSIFVGAELSSIPHTVGFPMTEQVITANTQVAVDGIHAQGAIAVFAHPTIAYTYAPVWMNFDGYGYDAFEVDCRHYFHCLGETAYFRPFMASNDGHSVGNHGLVRNVFFIENPSGPNGALTAEDIMDAVMNRRVVVLDIKLGLVFGQGVWVDRYLELWDEAEDAIENSRNQIELVENEGNNASLSKLYLAEAENAIDWWNPSRALRAANDAILNTTLSLDLAISTPSLGVVDSNSEVNVTFILTNRLDTSVQLNATPFGCTSLLFNEPSTLIQTEAYSTDNTVITATSTDFGYTKVIFNLKDFNTAETLHPVTFTIGGYISNVIVSTENGDGDYSISIRLLRNRLDVRMVSSIELQYNNGTGQDITKLENYGDSWGIVFGPFTSNVSITYSFIIRDILGNVFYINGVIEESDSPLAIEEVIVPIMIGSVLIGVIVVSVIIAKRRRR